MLKVKVILINVVALSCLYYTSVMASKELSLWVFGISQIILYGSHFVYLWHRSEYDLLDALNVLNLGFFLHFTLAPFLLYYNIMPVFYESLWNYEDFPKALVLVHALCVTIQLGYYLDLHKKEKKPFLDGAISENKLIVLTITLVLISLSQWMVQASLEMIGSYIIRSGIFIIIASLIFYLPYFIIMMKPPKCALTTSIVAFSGIIYSLTVSLFFGIGSKAGVVNLILAYVFYRNYFIKRIRFSLAAIGAVFGIMVVTYMNYVRASGYTANIRMDTVNPLSTDNIATFWAAGVSSTLTPFEAFMVVLNTFPRILPYQYGQRLLEDMIFPLFPRIIFSTKPEIYGVAFFWDIHRGFLSLENKIYESVSLPGHFYVDFGLPGLLACGVLVGIIHRYVYERLVLDGVTRGSICLYGILSAYAIISARAFFWTTYSLIASVVIPILILRWLNKGRMF